MTPTELLEMLCQRDAIPPSRLKDLKTSLRYLAQALSTNGQPLIQDAASLAKSYHTLLRAYLVSRQPAVSPHTIRNTLNNLSFLFRQAKAHGLIQTFTPRPERVTQEVAVAEAHRTSPYRHRFSRILRSERYWCDLDQWPPLVRQGWDAYAENRQLEVRQTSLRSEAKYLSHLVGYSISIEHAPVTTWDDLFEIARLKRFIHWHSTRNQAPRITHNAHRLVQTLAFMAKYQRRPDAASLHDFWRRLPRPEVMHDKQHPDHHISLKELEDVGLTLLHESRTMIGSIPSKGKKKHPYAGRAIRHQTALMLRFLVRVPMRQRNIREMQLGRNLYQDEHKVWQLRFQGEELKVSQRHGRTNIFHIPFPPDLVEHLEEFLQTYRPYLPNAEHLKNVFIDRYGKPYTQYGLSTRLSNCVVHRLGKRFYPHLIRTIWTDTCLLTTQDISTAAFMLNDRPETVLKRYHELRANDHIQKAHQFMQSLLG